MQSSRSKESAINLTSSERRSFFGFLGLYIASSALLILFFAISFYRFESDAISAMQRQSMQNAAQKIASQLITSFMHHQGFSPPVSDYTYSLLDEHNDLIYGPKVNLPAFREGFVATGQTRYLVDTSAQMHHGVKYIIIHAPMLSDELGALMFRVIGLCLAAIVIMTVAGYFLARMFLKPVLRERVRLDRFIKDTTHELNTPISALLMSVSKLRPGATDPKVLSRIQLSAKRLQNIYADLTFLLLHTEHSPASPIDLRDVLENELLLYEELAQKKKITFRKELGSVITEMDDTGAHRLFSNLLSNAIKYNRIGGVIELELNETHFMIHDNGIGINPEEKTRVLERFYRGQNAEGGFGIGLDIVVNICRRYAFRLGIESEKGAGTTIKIIFPDREKSTPMQQ